LCDAFRPTGNTPPFRIHRDYPLIPNEATADELRMYRNLVRRAAAAAIGGDPALAAVGTLDGAAQR